MKNIIKKLTCVFAALVLFFSTGIVSMAAPEIDTDRKASLTIVHNEAGVPIVGEMFTLYKIASADKLGRFTLLPPFDAYNIVPEGYTIEDWRGIAGALEGYILRDGISPIAVGVTDSEGRLTFETGYDLTAGLYLVGGTQHIQGDYKYISDPFCVTLPVFENNGEVLQYDVVSKPKFSSRITIDEPDATVTRRALKKWDDNGNEAMRPESIRVSLLRNGEVFNTAELNAGNNWTYVWSELDSDYRWTVVEEELENYNVRITLEGITFLITNTYDAPPPPPDETTTEPEETTTEAGESTTEPDESTTVPDESTTAPGESTTVPEENTTMPEESTTAPEESTTAPEESTIAPEVSTTAPENTTASPEGTTSPDEDIITSPGDQPTDSVPPVEDDTVPEDEPTLPGDQPTASEPPEETLPNTGQLWWPVPTLIAAGLCLIMLGLLRRRGWENE